MTPALVALLLAAAAVLLLAWIADLVFLSQDRDQVVWGEYAGDVAVVAAANRGRAAAAAAALTAALQARVDELELLGEVTPC